MLETATDPSMRARVQSWLPRGDTLDERGFAERHRTLRVLLGLHLPVLLVFGILAGQEPVHTLLEVGAAGVFLALASLPAMPRRAKGILVSAGLVWCSAVIVHFSGGMIEAHFHFFVILGFIALYQDWAAFGWAIIFTALSHGIGSTLAPTLMFNHESAIQRPWTWALIHAGMVLFAAVGQIIGWRHAEAAQDRATELNTQLIREQAERQASFSRIYVNLARRNQSLLHRQVAVIDELERTEQDPDTLRRLFALDHLTTRIRRNAESLLVMAGEESPRRWSAAIALADVARAAAAEIEQYERTDVRIDLPVVVHGAAIVDITHLLAELIENAAEYSSPSTVVRIDAERIAGGAVLTIEDRGIGMSEADLAEANATLLSPPELDDQVVRHLGFQVVGRLAAKLGLRVHLRPTDGGGTTAVVVLPDALVEGPGAPAAPADDASAATPPAPTATAPDPTAPERMFPATTAEMAAPPAPPTPVPVATVAPVREVAAAPSPPAGPGLLFVAKQPLPTVADLEPTAPASPAAVALPTPATRPHIEAPPTVPAPEVVPEPASVTAPTGPALPVIAEMEPVTAAPAAPPTSSGLPQRVPAASLAPGLRASAPSPDGPTHAPAPAPEARQALSAFQSAARAGRDAASTEDQL